MLNEKLNEQITVEERIKVNPGDSPSGSNGSLAISGTKTIRNYGDVSFENDQQQTIAGLP